MTKNSSFFTSGMKLADLIHLDYKLLLLLPRFGLNLGFRDQTAEECCARVGVSSQLFIMICNIYAFENYSPGRRKSTRLKSISCLLICGIPILIIWTIGFNVYRIS